MPGVNGDLWCGGHTFLADGRLLFVGGTSYYPPAPDPFYGGLKEAYLFDSAGDTWTRLPDMHERRWYPTLLRLADDTVLVISGLQYRDPEEEPRKQALQMYVDGMNLRLIGRHLGIHHRTVSLWVKAYADRFTCCTLAGRSERG